MCSVALSDTRTKAWISASAKQGLSALQFVAQVPGSGDAPSPSSSEQQENGFPTINSGGMQTDSADSQLCQESFQTLILLCSDSLHSFSEMGLCHLLPAPAASSLVLTPASVQGPEQHQLLWHKL
ncbi:hypothetical protein Anapl_11660 [Anas platyrhynchos]|uniref:Uncharacterized protein n=1 Tax=Anas platyrhynchos TaxID=8839 RepID=R0JMQ7_ANAPL|nr:hypothetical protein Anapl_11660 [Anas platyrhynchos]